ncbi:hypothetical protein BP5796_05849 [Coleophoma crateriformis]|uniref:Nephrocystin 3-like N-terminal domain-containing protein n=1 Tax=Coleophoma crateriformis TaxID=565419 RepID=A0A3D8RVA7_9HELO|nr:hypothetical protein BP5796_05849 [Coleophoma crateriformis]
MESFTTGLIVDADESEDSPVYDIVIVHGIGDDPKEVWLDSTGPGNWLRGKMFALRCVRIMRYGDDTRGSMAGINTLEDIKEVASRLLESLLKLRMEEIQGNERPLIFVTHDIGGIIVKQALVLAGLNYARFGSISLSTVALIFFGCPHRSINNQDMEDNIARLLLVSGCVQRHGFVSVVKRLAQSIIDINNDFLDTKMLIRPCIFNIFSTVQDPHHFVFDESTATMCIPFENRLRSGRRHMSLVNDPESDIYIKSVLQVLENSSYPLNLNIDILTILPILLSQSSPVFPLKSRTYPASGSDYINQNENFRKWMIGTDWGILHAHGTSGVSQASDLIYQQLEASRDTKDGKFSNRAVLFFKFNRHDTRFNTLQAMLSTFLAQIVTHFREVGPEFILDFQRLSLCHAWSSKDLYSVFENMCLRMENTSLICMISCLDECLEASDWLLEQLKYVFRSSECHYKVIITSTNSVEIKHSLSDFPAFDIVGYVASNGNNAPTDTPSIIELELRYLLQEKPIFYELSTRIKDLLIECDSDSQLRCLIVNWLVQSKDLTPKMLNDRYLEEMSPATPQNVLKAFLNSTSLDKRLQLRNAISWVLYAFRPLTCSELQVALAPTAHHEVSEATSQRFMADFREQFGSMLVVEHNEIYFGHPFAREFFTTTESPENQAWYNLSNEEIAHGNMARSCLLYLSSPNVQSKIESFCEMNSISRQSPIFCSRSNLLSYATQYWSSHYRKAKLTDTAQPFQHTKALRNWAQAYHCMSNPVTRSTTSPRPPLSIYSSLGLKTLVASDISTQSETVFFKKNCSSALIESARNGHIETTRLLLETLKPNAATLRDAVTASAACGEELSLLEIIKHICFSTEKFKWPQDILHRAAWLGLEKVTTRLVAVGLDVNSVSQIDGMSPLHLAVRNKHIQIVCILLEGGAKLQPGDKNMPGVLHTACLYGYPDIEKLLSHANADLENGCVTKWTPLEVASYYGQCKALEAILSTPASSRFQEKVLEALALAASRGHVHVSSMLLQERMVLKSTYQAWSKILQSGVTTGNVQLVELLLGHEDSQSEDTRLKSKNFALSLATELGFKDIVARLLDQGANPNESTLKPSPLYLAADNNYLDVVELLLAKGADVHFSTPYGWRPLHAAHNSPEIARALLNSGADVNCISNSGTILYLAARYNHPGVVKICLQYNPNLEVEFVEEGHFDGMTALTVAADCGNTEIMRLLLDAGANINHMTRRNNFPLQFFLIRNVPTEEGLRTLLEYNPNLELQDDDHDVALNCLTPTTPVSLVKLLVHAGAKLEIANHLGYTPLCTAIVQGNNEVVKFLLSKKAEVNNIRGYRGGPLHLACRNGSLELVKLLLDHGADINLADEGLTGTPLQSACLVMFQKQSAANIEVINYLVERPDININLYAGTLGYAISVACFDCSTDTVKHLISKGAITDVKDNLGRRPLHFASMRTLDHIKLLNPSVEDFAATDITGRTPLHYAAVSGQVDLVKYILDTSNCNVDERDFDQWTPLLWAARKSKEPGWTEAGQAEVINLLLSRGADLWARGNGIHGHWSPLKIARYHAVQDTVLGFLKPTEEQRLNHKGEPWDERFHLSEKREPVLRLCDFCLLKMWGTYYRCFTCLNFDLCFKCYGWKNTLHYGHDFEELEAEAATNPYTSIAPRGHRSKSLQDDITDSEDDE